MRTWAKRFGWVVLAATLGLVTRVTAQEPAAPIEAALSTDEDYAKKAFAAGRAAYDAGSYDEALQHFQHAYDLSKKPALLYNVGLAADRLRYNRAALEAFKTYVREVPAADNRLEVENRIRALEAVLQREDAGRSRSTKPSSAARTDIDSSLTAAKPEDNRSESLFSRWWFWTAAGVVVAAAATGIVVATSGDTVSKPVAGTGGVVVVTLRIQ